MSNKEPKVTMLTYKDGKVSGTVQLANGVNIDVMSRNVGEGLTQTELEHELMVGAMMTARALNAFN